MHCADKANLEAPKSMRDWQKYQEFVTELNGKAGDAIICEFNRRIQCLYNAILPVPSSKRSFLTS